MTSPPPVDGRPLRPPAARMLAPKWGALQGIREYPTRAILSRREYLYPLCHPERRPEPRLRSEGKRGTWVWAEN